MRARHPFVVSCAVLLAIAACTSASGPHEEPATEPPRAPTIPVAREPVAREPVAQELAATPTTPEPTDVRARIATGIVRASIMRLELGPPADHLEVGLPDRLGGYAIRKRSEHPLDAGQLTTLAALLGDPAGYDDEGVRRCAVDRAVGIRLVRADADAAEQRVDMVVDFPCQRLWVLEEKDAGGESWSHLSRFGPSRAAWVALLKSALPGDRQIARL